MSINREHCVTAIVITREQYIAAYADRVITMRDGQITTSPWQGSHRRPVRTAGHSGRGPQRPQGRGGMDLQIDDPGHRHAGSRRNRLCSALTMPGVFVSVAALTAMVAVGQGANEAVRKQIESLGTNSLVVLPGATTTSGVRAGFGSASTITLSDAHAIHREDPAVGQVRFLTRGLGQVQYSNRNWTTSVQGVSPDYPTTTNWQAQTDRLITQDDRAKAALVVLIGQTVYSQIFNAGENPIGAIILVKSTPLRVIGLLAARDKRRSARTRMMSSWSRSRRPSVAYSALRRRRKSRQR